MNVEVMQGLGTIGGGSDLYTLAGCDRPMGAYTVILFKGTVFDFWFKYLPAQEAKYSNMPVSAATVQIRDMALKQLANVRALTLESLRKIPGWGDPAREAEVHAAMKAETIEMTAEKSTIGEIVWEGIKDLGGKVFQGIQALNPVLVAARAAFLALVRDNVGGIANKIQQKGVSKLKGTWNKLGGSYSALKSAVSHGSTAPMLGIPVNRPTMGVVPLAITAGVDGETGGNNTLGALWETAKPIIEQVLKILGITMDTPPPPPPPDGGDDDNLNDVIDDNVTNALNTGDDTKAEGDNKGLLMLAGLGLALALSKGS